MKNITEYVSESMFITEFLGFGGKKQIDFVKQVCGAARGVNMIWMTNIKKNLQNYWDDPVGPIGVGIVFAEADKIICKGGNFEETDYDLSDSKNLRFLIKVDDKQYKIPFDGVQDLEDKIDSKDQHTNLVRIVNMFDKNIVPAVFEPLLNWAKENGYGTKADKIHQMVLQLMDALKKKPEGFLEFGQDKVSNLKHCMANINYVGKINDKLLKSVK